MLNAKFLFKFSICSMFLWPYIHAAAIVNIESVRPSHDSSGFKGKFSAEASGKTGNTDKESYSIANSMVWARAESYEFALMEYNYGESSDVKDSSNGLLHLRHVSYFDSAKNYAGEIFSQVQSNKFTRLKWRGLIGLGLRLESQLTSNNQIALGGGAFYSKAEIGSTEIYDSSNEEHVRANIYLAENYRVSEQASFLMVLYYQPSFEFITDYHLLLTTSIESKVTEAVSLTLGYKLYHDSMPPLGVLKTDVSFEGGLSLTY